ncbi:MAG: CHAT domain-containing protein, partial [Planctomycetota bacterium]
MAKELIGRRGDGDNSRKKKICFLAHGAGALVVRRLLSDNFPLNDTVRAALARLARNGGVRVLMLGAPHHGAASIAAMLTGVDATMRRLALLNPRYPLDRVLDLFASFPGLLELLPDDSHWFYSRTWASLRTANQGVGALPQEAALRDAEQRIKDRVSAGTGTKAEFLSVLGCGVGTAIDLRVKDNRLAVENTDLGDGRVAHESSVLPEGVVYYADADHSELATSVELLPAYIELLEHGATSRLPRTPYPSTEKAPYRSLPSPLHFPTRGELVDDLFGKKRTTQRRVAARHVTLSVLHGDLRFAKYPVMVGHYEGDTIGGVERYLDKKLRGVLVDRYRLGNYPGPLETSQTVVPHIDRHEKHVDLPAGALVIGLGRMGQLSCGELTRAVRHGLIDYAMEMSSRHDFDKVGEGRQQGEELGVSLLIIGSETAAMMTIEDCVASMLRGVAQANQELQRSRRRTRISDVEIVNPFLDTAINAAVVAAPAIGIESGTEFVFENQPPRLVQHSSGRLRIDPLPTSHTWRRWEITALPPPETREAVRQLPEPLHDILRDGLRHASVKNLDAREALFEMAFPRPKIDDAVPLGLRFVAMADRARAEKTVEGRQRPVIDNLIRRSIDDGVFRPQIAKALGQLLIPNDLKDGLANIDNLVLVLDGETATIPWELLVLDDCPLATRIGLIRQLIATNYRSATRMSHDRTAFVVGNPATQDNVPSLDGAQDEAREVAELLTGHGFSVEDRYTERADVHDVFVGLLQRSYRVLHLAGHGYFSRHKADKPARYGMLLNGNQYLTAQEIQQLPQVPELVFLNCCHLAAMEEETRSERQFEYSKLAASLAEELIKMGVRAIVAAGWAVRDDLAKEFATTFYRSMLDGEPFGHAVKDARSAVWQSASDSNTWAAYQAYGDPDYRLRFRSSGSVDGCAVVGGDVSGDVSGDVGRGGADRGSRGRGGKGRGGGFRGGGSGRRRATISRAALVTPRQLVEQLRQIAFARQLDDLESQKNLGVDTDSPEKMLDELVTACPSDWLKRVDVLSGLGRTHAELGRYQGAVDYYRRAIQLPSS